MAALRDQRRRWSAGSATGEGCFLDVSMLEASISAMGWAVSQLPRQRRRARRRWATRTPPPRRRARSTPPTARSTSRPTGRSSSRRCAGWSAGRTWSPTRGSPTARRASATATRSTRELERGAARARPPPSGSEMLSAAGVPAARILTVPQAVELGPAGAPRLLHRRPVPRRPGAARCGSAATACCVDGEPLRPQRAAAAARRAQRRARRPAAGRPRPTRLDGETRHDGSR